MIRRSVPYLLVAFVLLIRLPFLNQAIQGDDVYYLAGAEHAQIDPAHPNHTRYLFLGRMVDMRGHPHPPLDAWCLAALLALVGDVREVPFHAAYIAFSLIAALAMWSLGRRFCSRPVFAALLFLAVPAFVVNGNSFESDLPFLAFWMAAIALFVKAVDADSGATLAAAALVATLAALAAYQAVVLTPILAAYLFFHRRRAPAVFWLATLAAPVALAAWQIYERASSGALPAGVLANYLESWNFETLEQKVRNAAALTVHTAWIVFPALAVAALVRLPRWIWAIGIAAAAVAALFDWNPLFWVSFGVGVSILAACGCWLRDPDKRFPAVWVLIYFAAALVLFFAGSARYLLPMAAPVALLVASERGSRWLAAGFVAQLALSLGLAAVNYTHWDGYRRFASSLAPQAESHRVWINGEWGLRYYFEAEGGLPLARGQLVHPGEIVVSSSLAMPLDVKPEGGALAPLAEREITSRIPLRLISLDGRSAYSVASQGLLPFDISTGPIDRVRAGLVVERRPVLETLEIPSPEAAQQILSGIYSDGWMGQEGVVVLKRPSVPAPLRVIFRIPSSAPARHVRVLVDALTVAEATYTGPGSYTLSVPPGPPLEGSSATVTVAVDKTFSAPPDRRQLGILIREIGFVPK